MPKGEPLSERLPRLRKKLQEKRGEQTSRIVDAARDFDKAIATGDQQAARVADLAQDDAHDRRRELLRRDILVRNTGVANGLDTDSE